MISKCKKQTYLKQGVEAEKEAHKSYSNGLYDTLEWRIAAMAGIGKRGR